jgi:hypothetical protein
MPQDSAVIFFQFPLSVHHAAVLQGADGIGRKNQVEGRGKGLGAGLR